MSIVDSEVKEMQKKKQQQKTEYIEKMTFFMSWDGKLKERERQREGKRDRVSE